MREVAQARVCIDLPGNGPLCFRLIDYLTVGSCVVAPRPAARLHAPLSYGVIVVYCADDLSSLVEICALYPRTTRSARRSPTRRDSIRLVPRSHAGAGSYLHTIFARLD
jgi:hypothetical protein